MQRILSKIRKLVALQNSASRIGSTNEAEAAALAIGKLLTQYNLSMLDVEQSEPENTLEIGMTGLFSVNGMYGSKWLQLLLASLCRHNYCQAVGCELRATIVGTQVNTAIVFDMFNCLRSVYMRAAKRYEAEYRQHCPHPCPRLYVRSFLLGCVAGLDSKLDEPTDSACTALVIYHDRAIKKFLQNLRIRDRKKRRAVAEEEAYLEGYETGKNTPIRRSVEAKPVQQTLFNP
jgi:hypothetical protein